MAVLSPEDRTKEFIKYRIERVRIFSIFVLATAGGVLNLIFGDLSGLRLFLVVVGILLIVVLLELIRREDSALLSLLEEDSDA